jgi:hypothetical protein
MALDKSKPHGEAFGEGVKHKYVQDDKLFDKNGDEVDAKGKVVEAPKEVKAPVKTDGETTDPVLKAQLSA